MAIPKTPKPQTLYKLTDTNGQTRGGTQWGENVTHTATGGESQNLCSNGWIHAYEHPDLAVLLNPIHCDFQSPQLWESRGVVGKRDGRLKCGCRKLTTVKEIPLPEWNTTQRVAFGILCALEVEKDLLFVSWANKWLSGEDRSIEAAARAARAARAAEAAEAAARAAWAAGKPIDLIAIAAKAKEII